MIYPAFKRVFTNDVLINRRADWFAVLFAVMIGTGVFSGVLTFLKKSCIMRLSNKIEIAGASKYFWQLLQADMPAFTKSDPYSLISKISSAQGLAKVLTGDLLEAVYNTAGSVFYFIMMIQLDWQLSLVVLGLLLFNISAVKLKDFISEKINKKTGGKSENDPKKLAAMLDEVTQAGLKNIDIYKATASESFFFQKLLGIKTRMQNAKLNDAYENAYSPLESLPEILFLNILILVSAFKIMDRGSSFNIGSYLAFEAFANSFFFSFHSAVTLKNVYKKLSKGAESTVKSSPLSELPSGGVKAAKLTGKVLFSNVSFGYEEDRTVVKNISFSIEPGQRIAVIGKSGAGKTTLVKLLLGLYKPSAGTVTIDGFAPYLIDKCVFADSVGYASQKITLFSASIRDNITFWDDSVSEPEIYEAAEKACIHDYITGLSGAYDSMLNENGGNLSGGQKQRLEITRAFLRKPTILIFDETTSALDVNTIGRIEDELVKSGSACLVITNDLSRLNDYDEIIVLDKGVIIQRGAHETLAADVNGYYANTLHSRDW